MRSKTSILLIEEDLPLQKTLAQIFQHGGYTAVSAPPNLSTLSLLARHPFDLIVLDLNQFCDVGLSLFFKIKNNHPLLPVILLSPNSETDDIPNLEDEKAWMIIRKPYEPGFLLKSIYAITGGALKRNSQLLEVGR